MEHGGWAIPEDIVIRLTVIPHHSHQSTFRVPNDHGHERVRGPHGWCSCLHHAVKISLESTRELPDIVVNSFSDADITRLKQIGWTISIYDYKEVNKKK